MNKRLLKGWVKMGRKFLFLIVLLFIGFCFFGSSARAATTSTTTQDIVKTMDPDNHNEYAVINQTMSWEDAEAYCESLGGHLATVTSEGEEKFIDSLVANTGINLLWLGASDKDQEGNWKWVTGEPFYFSSWLPGEPDNMYGYHSENYLVIQSGSNGWNDVSDSESVDGFVCEWENSGVVIKEDVNNDGSVDIMDVALAAQNYNTNNNLYDMNGDSIVDIYDLVDISRKIDTLFDGNGGYSTGNTSGNLLNLGIAALDNNYVYYRNDSDGGKLYKESLDGTDKIKLSDDDVSNINVIWNWIYYKDNSDMGKLYKVRDDGYGKTKVLDDISDVYFISGNWIYYKNSSDNMKLYKVELDGSNKTKLSDDSIGQFSLNGDSIIYSNASDSDKLYKINLDGTGKVKLGDDSVEGFSVYNGVIYYINSSDNSYLYKIDASGNNRMLILNEGIKDLNANGTWIYYCSSVDGKLYKVAADGSSKTKIGDEIIGQNNNIYAIDVVQQWVYYINGADSNRIYRIKDDGTGKRAVDDFKVYQNGTFLEETDSKDAAVGYITSNNLDHSSVTGPDDKVAWNNYPDYRVYDGSVLKAEYSKGQLYNAISFASSLSVPRVVGLNSDLTDGNVLWIKGQYDVYSSEVLLEGFNSSSDALSFGEQNLPSIILDGSGNIIYDSTKVENGYVTASNSPLNVRSGPGTSYTILGTLNYLDTVEILQELTGWDEIAYNGGFAYVSSSYIRVGSLPALGFDVASKLTLDQYQQFKNGGYGFVARYYAANQTLSKVITLQDAQNISKAGLQIIPVYEDANNYVGAFSYNIGKSDCTNAINNAIAVGQPVNTTIYFAVDYDTETQTDFDAIKSYFQGIQDEMKSFAASDPQKRQWNIGVYGSYNSVTTIHDAGLASYFWQTYAWSSGQVVPYYNVFQYSNDVTENSISIDKDNGNNDNNNLGGFTVGY